MRCIPFDLAHLELSWLPPVDILEGNFPQSVLCLITDGGNSIAEKISAALMAKDVNIVVIGLDSELPITGPQNSMLPFANSATSREERLAQIVQEIELKQGKVNTWIHIEPDQAFQRGSEVELQTARNRLEQVFLLAGRLKDSLQNPSHPGKGRFFVVIPGDGAFGQIKPGNNPIPAGYLGLIQSLRLEWPDVFCRLIDFDSELDRQLVVKSILQELEDANHTFSQVGVSPQGRHTLTIQEEIKR